MAEVEQTDNGISKSELLKQLEEIRFQAEALYNFVPSLQHTKGEGISGPQVIFDELYQSIVSFIDAMEN